MLNKIINKLNELFLNINSVFCGFFTVIYCFITGIKLHGGNRFFGFSKFMRATNSTIEIGKNCRFRSKTTSNLIGINHKCIIATHLPAASLKIGNNCGFSGTTIGCFNEIVFGDNVNCGANTLITDSDWHLNDPRAGKAKPIFIGNNVWLGYGVIVLKGVSIGENSVIGAGSVVTKDVPANVIAAGNPCTVVKSIDTNK